MSTVGKFFRAPLLWFTVFGLALFVLDAVRQSSTPSYIGVSSGDLQRLQDQWQAQNGTRATPATLEKLVDALVRERRLAREAILLGLDQGDVIVQRRLAQKLRFLREDLGELRQPDDSELHEFFRDNAGHYQRPASLSLRHVFLNPNLRGTDIESDAARALSALKTQQAGRWRSVGDAYIHGRSFDDKTADELQQIFGQSFVEQLFEIPRGTWYGPQKSDLGLHLVIVDHRGKPRARTFGEVRDQVLYDFRQRQRATAFSRFEATLAEKYPLRTPFDIDLALANDADR